MAETKPLEEQLELDDPITKLFRRIILEGEAQAEESDLYCPSCTTHLPKRSPFFGWDEEKGQPSHYCTLCEKYF
ncbi:MAG: hypothetical protein ABIA37_04790 [Candidatus Woesearchaeota archaeon]